MHFDLVMKLVSKTHLWRIQFRVLKIKIYFMKNHKSMYKWIYLQIKIKVIKIYHF